MKKVSTAIMSLAVAMFVALPLATQAMTLADVAQQVQIYKSTSPSVLGASTPNGTMMIDPSNKEIVPQVGIPVIMKGLKFAQGSSMIVPKKIQQGDQNNDNVRALQLFLIAKGYLSADATGYYGNKTVGAVKKFQDAKRIPGGDGTVVGPATRAAISADVEAGASTPMQ